MGNRRRISQREAFRLRHRVKELEDADRARHNRYTAEYPGGIHMTTVALDATQRGRLYACSVLGMALVGKYIDGDLMVFAVGKP